MYRNFLERLWKVQKAERGKEGKEKEMKLKELIIKPTYHSEQGDHYSVILNRLA